MKKRTFYIINLDRGRILFLSTILSGVLLLTFASGFRLGRSEGLDLSRLVPGNGPETSQAAVDNIPEQDDYKNRSPEKMEEPEPEMDRGKSIYSIDEKQDTNRLKPSFSNSETDKEMDEILSGSLSHKEFTKESEREIAVAKKPAEKKAKLMRHNTEKVALNKSKKSPSTKVQKKEKSKIERDKSAQTVAAKKSEKIPSKQQTPDAPLLKMKKNSAASNIVGFSNVSTKSSAPQKSVDTAKEVSSEPVGNQRIFGLQLGAFSNKSGADRYADMVKKQGFSSYVLHRGNVYRVVVGRTTDLDSLEALRNKLKAKRYTPIAITIKGE